MGYLFALSIVCIVTSLFTAKLGVLYLVLLVASILGGLVLGGSKRLVKVLLVGFIIIPVVYAVMPVIMAIYGGVVLGYTIAQASDIGRVVGEIVEGIVDAID
jgi:hypothetical protein